LAAPGAGRLFVAGSRRSVGGIKILHIPFGYFPDPVGGAEIYVEALAKGLRRWGFESVICAPACAPGAYVHSGLRVLRFESTGEGLTVDDLYGDGDAVAAASFEAILAAEKADLVHFHALTPEVSPRLARAIKARGIPVVFTYHVCTATCEVGTLLRSGRESCDGEMATSRCSACRLQSLGMPKALASAAGRIPVRAGEMVRKLGLYGSVWTAVRMSELIAGRQTSVRSFLDLVDQVVAPSRWVREVLLANGVVPAKITLCEQGVVRAPGAAPSAVPAAGSGGGLRIVMLGRLSPPKGFDVLLDAFDDLRGCDIALDIYGLPATGDEGRYRAALGRRVAMDSRVRLLPPVPHEQVVTTIARYDVLAVPSQALETGPLVVLEAFAAGVPVLGSDLGGISERVVHERNGLLVPPFDRAAWTAAVHRLATEANLVERLSLGVSPPRDMHWVSREMRDLYLRLAGAPSRVGIEAERAEESGATLPA
jgi:glycosyltransferase involved in cell wall biosynthesis